MARRLEAMGRAEYVGLTVKKGTTREEERPGIEKLHSDPAEGGTPPTRAGRARSSRANARGVSLGCSSSRAVFNGVVRTLEDRLLEPMKWRKPRRVFVNSMSDLFHESVPFEFIDKVFAVMALCPQHTFQILTKRPERMAEYLNTGDRMDRKIWQAMVDITGQEFCEQHEPGTWPRPNVWLGTSVEDQDRADERIPHLFNCPAAVRFLSCEPLLGPLNLRRGIYEMPGLGMRGTSLERIQWVIAGGESGANARLCDVAWIRSIVAQCKSAGVPVFVKQLGAVVDDSDSAVGWFRCPKCRKLRDDYDVLGLDTGDCQCHACGKIVKIDDNLQKYDRNGAIKLLDRKGGDPAEWPEDLRVRVFPLVGLVG